MRRKKLVWVLFGANFVIALAAAVVVAVFAILAFGEAYFASVERDLQARARMVAEEIGNERILDSTDRLSQLAKSIDQASSTRVTVIARDGTVLANSRKPAWLMENHSDRPEFEVAVRGMTAATRRRSPTLGSVMMYAAAPVRSDGFIVGVARVSVQASVIDAVSSQVAARIGLAAGLVVCLAALASLAMAKRITKPLERIREAASKYAQADLTTKAPSSDVEEFASLAQSLNLMVAEIDRQIQALSKQASERDAILQSMKEGVLAVGDEDTVLFVNPAAEHLLGLQEGKTSGMRLQEVVRNSLLLKLVEETSRSAQPLSSEIIVRGETERVVQATAAPIVGQSASARGVVVVLNDVTQMRRLENMRR